jgi:inward rectifier potassium channel
MRTFFRSIARPFLQRQAASEVSLVLLLSGLDKKAVQELRARRSYDASLIRGGHRYADIIRSHGRGEVSINYARFHDVVPDTEKA